MIPFSVSGSASAGSYGPGIDHNASDGVITINSGTQGQTSVGIFFTNDPNEGDETVVFTMGTPTNAVAGEKTQQTVTITHTPQTLALDFDISQAGKTTPLVTTSGGQIRVNAATLHRNKTENPVYDWSQSNSSLVSADCTQSTFYVDPSNLAPSTAFMETSFPDQAASAEGWLRVGTAPALSDAQDSDADGKNDSSEGYQDDDNDGIPNHLDLVEASHLIPGFPTGKYKSLNGKRLLNQYQAQTTQVGWTLWGATPHINYPMLIATEPGLKLRAGSAHLLNYEQTSTATAPVSGFNTFADSSAIDPLYDPDDALQNDGKQFMASLEISQLPKAGGSAKLVIPRVEAIDDEFALLRIRSYTAAFGWQAFLTDNHNQVASSLRDGDYCPPPGSPQYKTGLIMGFECLQLTIQDGGANDSDGYVNGRIAFNGGVLPQDLTPPPPPPPPTKDAEEVVEEEPKTEPSDGDDLNVETPVEIIIPSAPPEKASDTGGGGGVMLHTSLLCLAALMRRRWRMSCARGISQA